MSAPPRSPSSLPWATSPPTCSARWATRGTGPSTATTSSPRTRNCGPASTSSRASSPAARWPRNRSRSCSNRSASPSWATSRPLPPRSSRVRCPTSTPPSSSTRAAPPGSPGPCPSSPDVGSSDGWCRSPRTAHGSSCSPTATCRSASAWWAPRSSARLEAPVAPGASSAPSTSPATWHRARSWSPADWRAAPIRPVSPSAPSSRSAATKEPRRRRSTSRCWPTSTTSPSPASCSTPRRS